MSDDIFDVIGEMDDRPSKRPNRIDAQANFNPNPDITDPRTRGSVNGAFRGAFDNVVNARSRGKYRNDTLNTESFNLGQLIANGFVTEQQVTEHMMAAAAESGLLAEDGEHQCRATINSGIKNGIASGPRTNLPKMDPSQTHAVRPPRIPVSNPDIDGVISDNTKADTQPGRRHVRLRRFSDLEERRPTWVWEYGGGGRIQLGTLSIFGGPPGTGKSTAARWFAAGATLGTLTGCWFNEPVNVAYIATEEDLDAMVKPSLRAAGSDVDRLFYPEVMVDESELIIASQADEIELTNELLDNDIRLLIVDPIMSTLGSGVDIHRNNEVRAAIQPFVNIAQKMNGLVVGIAHYRKSGAASGVAALTGSSAFGEVARSVFGFMKGGQEPDDPRVMSQSKNSAGAEDLALQYQLELTPVLFPDGVAASMTRFKILGPSDVTVEDLMAEGGVQNRTKVDEAAAWLEDYLLMNGSSSSKQVKIDARKDADLSEDALKRACRKLKIIVTNKSINGKPRVTFWSLPVSNDTDEADNEGDWRDHL